MHKIFLNKNFLAHENNHHPKIRIRDALL